MNILEGGNTVLIIVLIVVALLVIVVGWYISTSNKLNRYVVKMDEAESGIDVALTKRYDLLTKALAAVKGYAKHESETLAKIVEMRNPGKNASMQEKQEFANQQSRALESLNVVVEQYPNLKADTQFSALQANIADVEEQLQAARRLYNSNVSTYNQAIVTFPTSFVANRKGMSKRAFFEAEAAKRQDVKMEF